MTHLSVVIPVYNEKSLINELVKRVKTNLKLITEDFEILIVDDGSQDDTWNSIENEAKSENRIKGIRFSRNFGHHYAITAGLHTSNGDWVIVMDGDLQDRPEVIPELYKKAKEGFDIVFVSRINRPEKMYYKIAQKIFYFTLNSLTGLKFDSQQANFSIIKRNVVEAFKLFPENARFYGSTIKWLGFNRASIFADHGKRFSGSPSYTFRKRFKLAFDIIIAFSEKPLKILIFLGLIFSLLSAYVFALNIFSLHGIKELQFKQIYINNTLTFISGYILFLLAILSIYVGKIYNQVKQRPLYVISDKINL